MLTNNDIDDILFVIDKATGESYEPKHSSGWSEIENKLLAMRTEKVVAGGNKPALIDKIDLLVCDDCEIVQVYEGLTELSCIQCGESMKLVSFTRGEA